MKYLLHWKLYEHSKEVEPAVFSTNMSGYGYALDREIELSPPSDIYSAASLAAVTELRAEQARHTAAITEIDRKISELLCIEHKTGE